MGITIINRTMSDFTLFGVNIVAFLSAEFYEWQLWEDPTSLNLLVGLVEQGKAGAMLGNNLALDADGVRALGNPVMKHVAFRNLPPISTAVDLRAINPDNRIPKGCRVFVEETGGEYTFEPTPVKVLSIVDDTYYYIVPSSGTGYWVRANGTHMGPIRPLPLDSVAAATTRNLFTVTVIVDQVKTIEVEIIARSDDGEVGHYVSHLLLTNLGAGAVVSDHNKVSEQESDPKWTGIATSIAGNDVTVTFLGSGGDITVSRGSWREIVLE
jgi:hypothetical protein